MSDATRQISRRRPSRWLRRVRDSALFYFGLLWMSAVCLTWTPCAAVANLLLPAWLGRRCGRYVIMAVWRGFFGSMVWLGAIEIDVAALDELRDGPPLILAPNHPSMLDAFLIASRVPNLACVMKADLTHSLMFGAAARLAQYIINDAPVGLVRGAIDNLNRGESVLVFPEGTRTEQAPLGPLRGGIGLIASRAQVPVQTLLVEVSDNFLGKGSSLLQRPELPLRFTVRIGRRFSPPRPGAGNTQAFVKQLEQYFRAELGHDAREVIDPAAVRSNVR
jgi:1-acyl-sn-glycerol-3-phosphate acyltransferase